MRTFVGSWVVNGGIMRWTEGDLLIVDDDPGCLEALADLLGGLGVTVRAVGSMAEAQDQLQRGRIGVVLADQRLPDGSGLALLEGSPSNGDRPAFILLTAYADATSAEKAMRAGAFDYLMKPCDGTTLRAVVERAFQAVAARRLVDGNGTRRPPPEAGRLVGKSEVIVRLGKLIGKFAERRTPVLIQGETGTGKEIVARALHRSGRTKDAPFVPVDCGSIPGTLLEAELFGYERGAFTGADTRKPGMFELADGGTLFLDEVGNLPLDLQPKLLRALQDRGARRLGGHRIIHWSVRLVTASNTDLRKAVSRRAFRADLFYRISGSEITVPPLRDRMSDLCLLAEHFLASVGHDHRPLQLSDDALAALHRHTWPGNVRELEHAIEHAAAMANGPLIQFADLPDSVRLPDGTVPEIRPVAAGGNPIPSLNEVKSAHAQRVLSICQGVKAKAARILKINRRTLEALLRGRPKEAPPGV